MSFRISEEYCRLALELEARGYVWQPAPGDWMLDRDDASIGMLTVPVSNVELVRKLNTHLPTYTQVRALLEARGAAIEPGQAATRIQCHGRTLATFDNAQWAANEGECLLRALIEAWP